MLNRDLTVITAIGDFSRLFVDQEINRFRKRVAMLNVMIADQAEETTLRKDRQVIVD